MCDFLMKSDRREFLNCFAFAENRNLTPNSNNPFVWEQSVNFHCDYQVTKQLY